MKSADELREFADDANWAKDYSELSTLQASMINEANKGKYGFDTINLLDEHIVRLLKDHGYTVNVIQASNGGYNFHHRITWEEQSE